MIITNGKVRRTVPEQVSENMVEIQKLKDANFVRQDDVVDNLSSYQTKKPLSANQGRILNDKINAGIAAAYKPQGSLTVAAINALDTSLLENGYVFDVLDSGTLTVGSVQVNAGDNVAWIIDNGVGRWDKLSGLVDLSNFYTKAESDAKYVDLTTAQEISGIKTIQDGIKLQFKDNSRYIYSNNGIVIASGGTDVVRVSSTSVSPTLTNSKDLGNSLYFWKDLYLSGKVLIGGTDNYIYKTAGGLTAIGTGGIDRLIVGNSTTEINTNLRTNTNNAYDLGSSVFAWKDLYLGGKAYIGNFSIDSIDSNEIRLSKAGYNFFRIQSTLLMPYSDNVLSIGNSGHTLKDIYIAGNISDGTNTVNVADLAALITYAKAQGWIS